MNGIAVEHRPVHPFGVQFDWSHH